MAEFKTTQIFSKAVEYFFSSKLNVEVFDSYLRDDMFPDNFVAILLPLKNNILSLNDIEKIREFFINELEMKEGRDFQKELKNMKKKGLTNASLWLEFYYNAMFVVEIQLIYARIDGKEYFFLSLIIVENKEDDEEMNEMIISRAKKVLEGTKTLEELMQEWKKAEEKEKSIIDEKDRYTEIKELVNTLEEFKIQYSSKGRKIYIKADVKPNSLETSLSASMICISKNNVEIIVKESLFSNDKMIIFRSSNKREKEIKLGKNVKLDYRDQYLILKFNER
jgi:YHS domain-containing protein